MGRIVIVGLICLAFIASGCEAFKDHYDPPPEEVVEGVIPPDMEIASDEETRNPVTDFTVDMTGCEPIPAITVTVAENNEVANSGWTAENEDELTILATKIGEFTTAINITKGTEVLFFRIKQISDEEYAVCEVSYQGCPGECFGAMSVWGVIETGSLEIFKFNEANEAGIVINAGHYDFTFSESNLGDAGVSLAGDYMVEGLVDQMEAETETE